VGRWNRRFQYLGDQFDDIAILKEYHHPLFEGDTDSENLNYDFNLLKLDSSSSLQPIRLNDQFFVPNTNQAVTAIGFGQTQPDDGSSESTILQQVDLKYIPNEQCSLSSDGLDSYEGLLSEAMMCAADEGKDACFGDSGGPLVARNFDSQPVDGDPSRTTDVLVGLTSWGFGCADANFPGMPYWSIVTC
jgi:secreted trypsin-like serine protease